MKKKRKKKTTKFGETSSQSIGLRKLKNFHEGALPPATPFFGGLIVLPPARPPI